MAPSLIPKKSSERVKTDRRDAVNLARLERAGELTAVYVPQLADEALRDLSRAREDAKRAETRARQQLLALLLRPGLKYSGKTAWSQPHLRWLASIKLPQPAQQIAFPGVCRRHLGSSGARRAAHQPDSHVVARVAPGASGGRLASAARSFFGDGRDRDLGDWRSNSLH